MAERINEYKEQRTLPRNTSGQSMLSGNVFCGHCGGRLTLTTNGTVRKHVDGTTVDRRRIRYVCYNKTRHRLDCSGQIGYTLSSTNFGKNQQISRRYVKVQKGQRTEM